MCTGILPDVYMRVHGPLEPDMVLGIEPEFSGRAVSAINHRTISPALIIKTFCWLIPMSELSFQNKTFQNLF